MILYAVGDIHGCADLLLELRQKISADAAKRLGPKKLVFLGDYVDRGPQSADVIDVLMRVACPHQSGPVFELVLAPMMELKHGQESQA